MGQPRLRWGKGPAGGGGGAAPRPSGLRAAHYAGRVPGARRGSPGAESPGTEGGAGPGRRGRGSGSGEPGSCVRGLAAASGSFLLPLGAALVWSTPRARKLCPGSCGGPGSAPVLTRGSAAWSRRRRSPPVGVLNSSEQPRALLPPLLPGT